MDCHLIQIMYPTNKKHPSKFLLQHGFCTLETWSKTDPQGLRGRFVVLPHASRVRCDKAVWDVKKGTAGNLEDHPWTCTSETLLGSLLFNRDPYNSLLQSPHNWVVYSPTWRIILYSRWLINMVIISPLQIGLFPFQMA